MFRLCVKFRSFRRFYSDDFLVIAAWAMMLANSILWQIYRPALYEFYAIQSGKKPFTSGFVDRYMPFLHNIVSFTVLFYTCIWTVKLSFLLFFRRLGSRVRGHTIWWWCVLVITVLTWVACVADIQYKCVLSSFIYVVGTVTPLLVFLANTLQHIAKLSTLHIISIGPSMRIAQPT